MKSEDFIGLLGGIDSKFVEKASEDLINWQKSQEGELVNAVTPRKASLWLPVASVVCAAAAVVGGFFLIRNIRQNGFFNIASVSDSSSVRGGDTDSKIRVPVSTVISESSPVSSGDSSESEPVIDRDPTRHYYENMMFEAVDPVNDLITYSWAVEPDRISYEILNPSPVSYLAFEDSETSSQYLYEFFGSDRSLVSGAYSDWQRCLINGEFQYNVPDGTGVHVYTPVGGRVITVAKDQEGFGNAVAVEMPGRKIFVIYHLDDVFANVGDIVSEYQPLGARTSALDAEYKPQLSMVIMKKKTDPPEQELSEEFDGLMLGISTNKTVYEVGEPIHLTATVENNMGRDIYLSYGGSDFHLNPHIEELVEYPHRVSGAMDDIAGYYLLTQGEKVVQDFTFQTYTGYYWDRMDTTNYDGTTRIYPDPDKPAESGTYFGYLDVTIYTNLTIDVPEEDMAKTCRLEFTVKITDDISKEVATDNTALNYTEDMLKDYFIYKGVLYTNCYTDNIDWAIGYFEQLEPGEVGELVTVIGGKADLQRFKDDTANVLPAGSKIYEFPGNGQLLIARSGDEYIPYMKMVEG